MNIKELDLLEKQDAREKVISRTEVLDKVGELLLLPNTEYATIEQVAKYYEVSYQSIETIVSRYRSELESDGFKLFRKKEIESLLKSVVIETDSVIGKSITTLKNGEKLEIPNRGLRLFSMRAILRVAFYLTESEVARQVRYELLKQSPETYYKISEGSLLRFKKYETDMEYFLKALFGEELVKTQVPCGKYLLDFIIGDTIHIEVDEYGHNGYDERKEKKRDKYILNHTDYYTFRFNPHENSKFELVSEIFDLYEHIGFPSAI